jgi:hypothetical protein
MSEDELDQIASLGTGRAIASGLAVKSPVLLDVFFRYSREGIQEPTPLEAELQDNVDRIRDDLDINT